MAGRPNQPRSSTGTLGTFAGVFTPSILTILGIILFLRLGYVVGAAGITRALLIIGVANLISVLTSFSLATVATNLRVKGGGDYYLISRTLGVEFGGALGLVLFVAQSVSVAFYAIGFGEAMVAITGAGSAALIAAIAIAVLFVLAYVGADAATRFQYVVMVVLGLALIGFFVGGLSGFDAGLVEANTEPASDLPFWTLFAIFFPAVTGFTQGVSMSGDLRDPSKSLPLGTFLAVGVSVVVYFGAAIVLSGSLPGAELVRDYNSMRQISIFPWLVDAGVIAATLSSALASFLGAPRILQSLARDRVFPVLNPFAVGHGPGENPRRGVLLALGIALATVAAGNLNVVASVVSMFFLISYGLLNFATYYESRAQSPSFRPTFRWHSPRVSLIGAIACGGAMLAIDPLAGAVAGAILFGILQYVRRTVRVARWASTNRSARMRRIREDLAGISVSLEHPRDWRPVILAFSDDPDRRIGLLRFAHWIEGDAGFVTVVRVLESADGPPSSRRIEEDEDEIRDALQEAGVKAFVRSVYSFPTESVVPLLLGAHGIGEIRANTILLNRPLDTSRPYGKQMRLALGAGANVIVLDSDPDLVANIDATALDRRRIDVWYRDDASGRLALLLAYLTTRTPDWKDAKIRLVARGSAEQVLSEMLQEVRINAEPYLVDDFSRDTVSRVSAEASLVLAPFGMRGEGVVAPDGGALEAYSSGLGVIAYVMAARDFDLDAAPEEGEHEQRAKVLDRAEEAERVAKAAEKQAEQVERELSEAEHPDEAAVEAARVVRRQADRARDDADRARLEADDEKG
jgi:amino acid transporter